MKLRLAIVLIFTTSCFLQADGGIPIGQSDGGEGLRVTVFAAPVPVRAGAVDVSVLVQETASGLPVSDAAAAFSLQKLSPPSPDRVRIPAWCAAPGPDGYIPATSAHSKNKLLRGAFLPVTESGLWELTVHVARGPAKLTLAIPLHVGPPKQPLVTWWPLIALVPLAIALYAWRGALVRRRTKSPRP